MVNIQSQFTQCSYLDGVHHRSTVCLWGTVPSSYQFTSLSEYKNPSHICDVDTDQTFSFDWNYETAIKQTCHMSNNFQSTEYTTNVQNKNTTKRKLMKKKIISRSMLKTGESSKKPKLQLKQVIVSNTSAPVWDYMDGTFQIILIMLKKIKWLYFVANSNSVFKTVRGWIKERISNLSRKISIGSSSDIINL